MVDSFPSALLEARLQAVEAADSAQGMLDAVEALADLGDEGATDMLIRVLAYNNPGAAVAAVDGLIKIGTPAASAVLEQIDGYNYGARAWALRVLAGIGDPRGLDLVIETALEDFSLSVRRAAARGLGAIQWEKLTEPQQRAGQLKARDALLIVTQDGEWVVRYSAVVGLQGLITAAFKDLLGPMETRLKELAELDETVVVQARAQWAMSQLPDVATS